MIDRNMSPLEWSSTRSWEQVLESYALSYLASYNLDSIVGRTMQSFVRAFGMNNIVSYPRVTGRRPAFVVATWTNGSVITRATMAMEGATNLVQIMNYGGAGASNPTGLTGYVQSNAYAWASAMLADNEFPLGGGGNLQARYGNFCVAGFSLGAAVAEIAAAILKKGNPYAPIKLHKFGSPRVGTAAWASADQHTVDRMSWYVKDDPCGRIPVTIQNRIDQAITDPWSPIIAFYAPNQPETRIDYNGDRYVPRATIERAENVYAQSILPLVENNPWYDHQYDRYRLAFANLSAARRDHLYYRFAFLEFPDDNQWGYLFNTGTRDTSLLHVLGANPPDQAVDLPNDEVQAMDWVGAGQDADTQGATVGGADNDMPAPVIQRVNPHLRTRHRAGIGG